MTSFQSEKKLQSLKANLQVTQHFGKPDLCEKSARAPPHVKLQDRAIVNRHICLTVQPRDG